jgi:hypothetical protein
MTHSKICCIFFALSFINVPLKGQDDLMAELSKTLPKEPEYVYGTFKGTRLVNLHTVETLGARTLEFRIAHRFGDFSGGINNFGGLDGPATIQFHFDYGVNDHLTLGIGRSSYNKMYDASAKYNWVRQTTDNSIPMTLTFMGSINVISDIDPNMAITGIDRYQSFNNRAAYLAQVIIARKFNSKLSLQVTPLYIHYNMAVTSGDQNDMFAVGLSGRYKITKRMALTGEYIYRLNKYSNFDLYHNALSLGLDLETGGHVFQVFITNSAAINEVVVVPYTESSWTKGQVRLGFNISRVFGSHKPKILNQ